MKFEQAYNKLKEPEGGYTDGKNQRKDEPIHMAVMIFQFTAVGFLARRAVLI